MSTGTSVPYNVERVTPPEMASRMFVKAAKREDAPGKSGQRDADDRPTGAQTDLGLLRSPRALQRRRLEIRLAEPGR